MSHGPVKVLVVEDDDEDAIRMRSLLREMLSASGLEYRRLHDGQEIVENIRDFNPDVVVLDYNLPGRNGLQILNEISGENESLPVVVVTGFGDEQVAVESLHAGALDYISKNTMDGPSLVRALFRAMAISRYDNARKASDIRAAHHRRTVNALFHASQSAIVVLDRHEGITDSNPAAHERFGWNARDMQGKNFHDLVHRVRPPEDHHDPFTCPVEMAIRGGSAEDFQDDFITTSDGKFIPCNIQVIPMGDTDDSGTMIIVTPLIISNPASDAAMDRLRRDEQERTDMLNVLGHLLQTPMTPIIMRIAQLKARGWDRLDERQQDAMVAIDRNVRRMQAVVETSLVATRLRRGELRIRPQDEDINVICDEVFEAASDCFAERFVKPMRTPTKLKRSAGSIAKMDGNAIRQALHTILLTAMHRSVPDSTITMGVTADEQIIEVAIRDNGPKYSPDEILGLMDPFGFLMADASTGESAERTLWFYVARLFIEAHGGRLEIDSRKSATTYIVRLPVAGPARTVPPRPRTQNRRSDETATAAKRGTRPTRNPEAKKEKAEVSE